MKIPTQLPQFNKHITCIAVITRYTAQIYTVHKGVIKKVSDIRQRRPTYSDREGFFLRSGEGQLYGTGSVYESKDEELTEKFSKKVAKKLDILIPKYKFKNIFILEPKHLSRVHARDLSKMAKKRVVCRVGGNFSHYHPLELVEKVKKSCRKHKRVLE